MLSCSSLGSFEFSYFKARRCTSILTPKNYFVGYKHGVASQTDLQKFLVVTYLR